MSRLRIFFAFALLFNSTLLFSQTKTALTRLDARVDSVLALMTLDEKIGQLNQLSFGIGWGPTVKVAVPDEYKEMIRQAKIGSFLNAIGAEFTGELQKIAVTETRLKIPLLFGLDVIHGFKTTFPIPLAEASSWNTEIAKKSAHYQAQEAASAGIHWTFNPMVDIARDPRWGRIMEGSGEDPYLGSLMSAARVQGYQGNLSDLNVLACVKHYAGYGGAEGGRDYNTVDFSERTFRDIYLPPYKAGVEAGAATLMAAFNEIGGVPASSSSYLLNDILRGEWKFDGFVVSDWNSIGELINHGVAADLKQAGKLAINAGLDMDMESRAYLNHLKELIAEKKVNIETVNTSVRRILRMKFMLGLFDDPYRYSNKEREKNNIMTPEVKAAALDVARHSMVLLKNNQSALPLDKKIGSIALIGPLADNHYDPIGGWNCMGVPEDVVSVYDGLKQLLPGTKINYALGCKIDTADRSGFADAINAAKQSEVIVLCLGESRDMSAEARSRSVIELPGVQEELFFELKKTGKKIIVVLMNGRPLAIPKIQGSADAILEAWFAGTYTGTAVADILFGNFNPSGKLPVTFPYSTGQIPMYYNHKNTGRPGNPHNSYSSKYFDLPLTPLYPFGYGLSFTEFQYGKPTLSKNRITKNETLTVTVTVSNTGNFDGEETVQLYIRDLVGSVTRPVKELKGFKKVFLKKGETVSVNFTLTEKDLRFTADDMKFKSEPGMFKLYTGSNSADVQETEFELAE